jgi:hypothetical protein
MKTKILIAFCLLFIGLIYVGDWIIFATQEANKKKPWVDFKSKYGNRFPDFLQFLVHNSILFTFFFIARFGISGLIFINHYRKENKKVYLILGIFSIIMAGWQLFSLM